MYQAIASVTRLELDAIVRGNVVCASILRILIENKDFGIVGRHRLECSRDILQHLLRIMNAIVKHEMRSHVFSSSRRNRMGWNIQDWSTSEGGATILRSALSTTRPIVHHWTREKARKKSALIHVSVG